VLPVKNPKSVHGQFRHARLTEAGTLLVAHMDMGKVVEYDSTGQGSRSNTPGIATWSAERLENGNTLIAGANAVREVHPTGATVWEFTPADVRGLPVQLDANRETAAQWEHAHRYLVQPVGWAGNPATAPVQALEVTPEERVVWRVAGVGDPVDLGPATTIQLLDTPGSRPPEAVHFGDLRITGRQDAAMYNIHHEGARNSMLDDDLWTLLHMLARQSGGTISELVRNAIRGEVVARIAPGGIEAFESVIGLWKGRTDIGETEDYVRDLRRDSRLERLAE